MKSIGKALGKEIARIVVILVVIATVVFYLKGNNWFKKIFDGDTEDKYEFVVKRFSKKNELLVADAAVDTTANQTFNSNATKDWPEWTKNIADLIVSRKLEVKVPVKTELRVSASMRRVRKPALAKETAKFTEVVDFPSPGWKEVNVKTFKSRPLNCMLVRIEL